MPLYINRIVVSVHRLRTCGGGFLGPTPLVEQNGGDQDDHFDHDGDEGLERLLEADDLQQ